MRIPPWPWQAPAGKWKRLPPSTNCRLIAVTGDGPEALPSPSPFHGYFQKPLAIDSLLDYLAGIPPQPTGPMAAVA